MKKIWNFFDKLNEIVYVTDMDSNELIYMNQKGMELYNIHSLDELDGLKCYELLYNNSTPCAFCNNNELEEGCFKEWQYFNPTVNKYFSLKDTMIMDGNRRCRLEIALDNSRQEKQNRIFLAQQNYEHLANEGIRLALTAETPDKSIDIILEYLGKTLNGERTYIFERNASGCDDNTYEWVAKGVIPAIDSLQNLPPEVCANWYQTFSKGSSVIMENIENIREDDPAKYEILKNQNIKSLVVIPLYCDNEVIGFYGVDNPESESFEYIQNMLQILGHFIVSCLKRRNILKQLEEMSYLDALTKFGNRFAIDRYIEKCSPDSSLGVVYCDITGLKRVNDSEGHIAGDRLILRACDSIKEVFGEYGMFRIGGDELLILCPGIEQGKFTESAANLKQVAHEHSVILAVGAAWHEKKEDSIDYLLSEAERLMYEDKSQYYKNAGIDRRK